MQDTVLVAKDSIPQKCICYEEIIAVITQYTWLDILTIIASVVTIVGFALTLYQVWGVRSELNKVQIKIDDAVQKERERNINNAQIELLHKIVGVIEAAIRQIGEFKLKRAYSSLCSIKGDLSRYKGALRNEVSGLADSELEIVADMSAIQKEISRIRLIGSADFSYIVDDLSTLNTILTTEIQRLKNE